MSPRKDGRPRGLPATLVIRDEIQAFVCGPKPPTESDLAAVRAFAASLAGPAPQRVQMSRQVPWRADHPDAVICDRRSPWGNPFRIGAVVEEIGIPYRIEDARDAVRLYANWLSNTVRYGRGVSGSLTYFGVPFAARPTVPEIQAALAGKDLACWCALDAHCHVDVLGRIANNGRWRDERR